MIRCTKCVREIFICEMMLISAQISQSILPQGSDRTYRSGKSNATETIHIRCQGNPHVPIHHNFPDEGLELCFIWNHVLSGSGSCNKRAEGVHMSQHPSVVVALHSKREKVSSAIPIDSMPAASNSPGLSPS